MIDIEAIPSPCYVLEEEKLEANLVKLRKVKEEAGVEILLAFKGFAMWSTFPLVKAYLTGATASSLNEAKLCYDEMNTKAHSYQVAYKPEEFDQVAALSSTITFNSLNQYREFRPKIPVGVSVGLRVNPEWSDVATDLYNPASPTSRLGITAKHLRNGLPEGVEGLHFHVLCESDSRALEKVLQEFEVKFGHLLHEALWVNMGGGHLITREGYDQDHLVDLLKRFKEKHGVNVILEPGSAIAWQTGFLRAKILDIVENGGVNTIIPDISFTCHMPDCLEMPYQPAIKGATVTQGQNQGYSIGGISCLAGDFVGTYKFDLEPSVGDPIIFEDMIHYTMVKTNVFNGVAHPSIGIIKNGKFFLERKFDYQDYKGRLS